MDAETVYTTVKIDTLISSRLPELEAATSLEALWRLTPYEVEQAATECLRDCKDPMERARHEWCLLCCRTLKEGLEKLSPAQCRFLYRLPFPG